MNDEQVWLQKARRGDKDAFGQLIEAYQGPVYNLAYRMLGNSGEAEEAAQEAFIRAYTRLDSYDPAHKFSTWLLSITSNYCIDLIRKLDTEELAIVDFKSTERAQEEDVTRDQLHVYALGYEELTGENADVEQPDPLRPGPLAHVRPVDGEDARRRDG